MIRLRVCQGESKTFADNAPLGEIELSELPANARAKSTIEVSFLVDANGMLQVSARDVTTGRAERANLSILGVSPEGAGRMDDEHAIAPLGEVFT